MRAMVLEKIKTPLKLMELPIPEPGPGQVQVRVLACGVCPYRSACHRWRIA